MTTPQNLPVHKRHLATQEKPPLIAAGDLQFLLATLLSWALRLLPSRWRPRILLQLSRWLGWLWYHSHMRDVRRVRFHLQRLFGQRWTPAQMEQQVRQQLSLTVWNFFILNLIPTLSTEQAANLLPVMGVEHLVAAQKRGQPVLLLAAHVGPYAYPIAAQLLAQGFPVREAGHARPRVGSSRLYRRLYWPRVAATVTHLQVINTLDGPQTALLDVFRQGEILFLLPDQFYILGEAETPSRHLVAVPFLGQSVNLETGGLRLAKRMQATVMTVLPVADAADYRVEIVPLPLPGAGLRPVDLAADLRGYLDRVEAVLAVNPSLWRDLRRADLLARLGMDEVSPW